MSANGVSTDPANLEAVERYPQPTDIKTLRSFCGLVSYYRPFVPNFVKVAGPIHALTKKEALFLWTLQ